MVWARGENGSVLMMSILISGCMLTGKLPSTLMHIVIIPLLKYKFKYPADVNNSRLIAIATALSEVLELVLLSRLARYLWTADCRNCLSFGVESKSLWYNGVTHYQ